jgi:hypothetical protein
MGQVEPAYNIEMLKTYMYGDMEEAAGLKEEKAVLSRGLMTSGMEREPFFFFPFELSFLFRVWMPSFFMVRGRFTCSNHGQRESFYY